MCVSETRSFKMRETDSDVKNKWKPEWLDEKLTLKHPDPDNDQVMTVVYGETVKKLDEPGQAYCGLCKSIVRYGMRGELKI